MAFTKTLNFQYEDLGKEARLIFTFDEEKVAGHQRYRNYFPVVWKVAHLQASGAHQFSTKYTQQFVFATSEIHHNQVTTSSALTRIDFKESTTLTGDADNGYNWSKPVKIPADKNIFEAVNDTDEIQGIALCTQETSSIFDSAPLLHSFVDPLATLKVEFTGRLRIYAVTDAQKRTPIESEITSPPLWDHYIDEKDLPDKWQITYDNETKEFKIHPVH